MFETPVPTRPAARPLAARPAEPTARPASPSRPPAARPAGGGGPVRCPAGLVLLYREVARQPGRLVLTLTVTVVVLGALAALPPDGPTEARAEAAAGPVELAPLAQPGAGDRDGYQAVAVRAAAEVCPGLPAPVLVAIAEVESGYGVQATTSSRGAEGPMQFLPATFRAYATDGDGDGQALIHEPIDAVYSAARYLCANGGAEPDRLRGAVWNYNRSRSYVNRVLDVAGLA